MVLVILNASTAIFVGFLVNLFTVLPVLANQATLSFEPVVVPNASVAQCILDIKRKLSEIEASSVNFDTSHGSVDNINELLRSC